MLAVINVMITLTTLVAEHYRSLLTISCMSILRISMPVLKCSPARAGLMMLGSVRVIFPLLVTIEYAFVKVMLNRYFCC